MYADYEYYTIEYGGAVFKSASAFTPYERKAERRIDVATTDKLISAFPQEEKAVQAVKDCVCELAEFLYEVDIYRQSTITSTGVLEQSDGSVRGKVIKSVSSGSESISYSTAGDTQTVVSEAAKDRNVLDCEVYAIIRNSLSGVEDENGINLLYAGAYPGRR